MAGHVSCDCKCKCNSTTCNSKQKWNNKTCKCKCKNYRKCKKGYSWSPRACTCENSKYLKSVADTLVTECDEIVIFMYIVSTKDKYYSKKHGKYYSIIYEYCFYKLSKWKSNKLLYFTHSFISNHINIDNYYHYHYYVKQKVAI